MFKYLSDILAQFATQQKMRVLIFLLVAAMAVVLGRQFITSTNSSPAEMKATIHMQKEQIIDNQIDIGNLNLNIRALSDTILNQNRECNENAIQIEKVYTQKLIDQQRYVISTIEELMHSRRPISKMIPDNAEQEIEIDTINNDMLMLLRRMKIKFGQAK